MWRSYRNAKFKIRNSETIFQTLFMNLSFLEYISREMSYINMHERVRIFKSLKYCLRELNRFISVIFLIILFCATKTSLIEGAVTHNAIYYVPENSIG